MEADGESPTLTRYFGGPSSLDARQRLNPSIGTWHQGLDRSPPRRPPPSFDLAGSAASSASGASPATRPAARLPAIRRGRVGCRFRCDAAGGAAVQAVVETELTGELCDISMLVC